ncbi:MAG: GDP-mannose 4,6-dehydratase [archaeon]|nr:GDP-mannose 4,6-dehydratase [Candidatus Bathyarchaeum sp.]
MSWQDKRVLISGNSRFVGRWLLDALAQRGAKVTVLLKELDLQKNHSLLTNKKQVSIEIGQLEDLDTVEKTIKKHEIETCFHLSAQDFASRTTTNPTSKFYSNITGTWNILEGCRKSESTDCLVVVTNSKIYGEPNFLPLTEDHPLLAGYPVEASKACADILSRMYNKTYGLPVAVSRCSNVYGGGDLVLLRVVPSKVCPVILNKNPPIRSDGSPVRDYLYISDAIDAFITMAERIKNTDVAGQAFNIGSSEPLSILQITKKIIEASGKNHLKPDILNIASPTVHTQYLSCEKAKTTLKWTPKVSIEEGLKKTIHWFEENRNAWINDFKN